MKQSLLCIGYYYIVAIVVVVVHFKVLIGVSEFIL